MTKVNLMNINEVTSCGSSCWSCDSNSNSYLKMELKKEDVLRVYEESLKEDLFVSLKEEQLQLITAVCNRKNVLGVLPTGFGKSLVYYVAPLVMDKVSTCELLYSACYLLDFCFILKFMFLIFFFIVLTAYFQKAQKATSI